MITRIREAGRRANSQKQVNLGVVEGGMGSNMKSAWQVGRKLREGRGWEGACRAYRKLERVEGLPGRKPEQLSLCGMFKIGMGKDVC